MGFFAQLPEWEGKAILGAVIAALGYVLKLFIDLLREVCRRSTTRRSKLVQVFSYLRASKAAYEVQCEHRNKLAGMISERDNELAVKMKGKGYEALFTVANRK